MRTKNVLCALLVGTIVYFASNLALTSLALWVMGGGIASVEPRPEG